MRVQHPARLRLCGAYDDLAPFADYPGRIVNSPLDLTTGRVSALEAAELFGRPFMGGMDRHGVIATGGEAEIAAEVDRLLQEAPDRYVLGADCTLPSDLDWDRIRTAIDAAHAARGG